MTSLVWTRVPIVGLCAKHVDCVNRTAPVVDGPTAFKMIRTTNVRNGFIDTEKVRYVTEATYKRWTRRLVPQRGDIILTREAPLGDVGKLRTDDYVFLGQRLYHFRPDPGRLDADFFLYSLMAPDLQGQIRSFGSGATVEHMRLADIPKLEIAVPPLPIQRQIGRAVAAYDNLIENNTQRIKILEQVARALYREWFVEFRFPGHEKHERITSELGQIPQGWHVVSFTELADVLSGGTPKTDVREYWNGDVPFFTPRDAPTCFYVRETEKHLSSLGLSKCSSDLYPPGTVFITARGTVGKVAMPSMPMAMNQSCYALRGTNGITQAFLFLLTLAQVDYLKKNTGGATFDTIIVDTFRRMQVVEPPLGVIADFTTLVEPMLEEIQNLDSQNANLREMRDLILPGVLSGKIDVGGLT